MTKRLLRYILLLPLFLGIFSCQNSGEASNVLADADSLMQTRPDSALLLLEGISAPQLLSRAHRAEYALLLTQARHKNYVKLENDSLIKIAVDYYEDGNDNLRESQAYFYLGSTYRDMGDMASTIKAYLKALEVMPEEGSGDLLNILAECYQEHNLDSMAMDRYRQAYRVNMEHHNEKGAFYSLRGIGFSFIVCAQLDSTLLYYQKALSLALAANDSDLTITSFIDLASVYNQKKNYARANYYVSESLKEDLNDENRFSAYYLKGQIMVNLDRIDSASYYFALSKESPDIYVKTSSFHALYEADKIADNWKSATFNADSFIILYDSIQELLQRVEIDKTINNHLLEKHKHELSVRQRILVWYLLAFLLLILGIVAFGFLWIDKRRKHKYIVLQQKLMQNCADTIWAKEESFGDIENRPKRLLVLHEQQLQLCIELFRTTDCYAKLSAIECVQTAKSRKITLAERTKACTTICEIFADVISELKENCPELTDEDLLYCVFSLLNYSPHTIADCMGSSLDALKTRKNRIKNKINEKFFLKVFSSENK